MGPKTALLLAWPRDAQRSDTPGGDGAWSRAPVCVPRARPVPITGEPPWGHFSAFLSPGPGRSFCQCPRLAVSLGHLPSQYSCRRRVFASIVQKTPFSHLLTPTLLLRGNRQSFRRSPTGDRPVSSFFGCFPCFVYFFFLLCFTAVSLCVCYFTLTLVELLKLLQFVPWCLSLIWNNSWSVSLWILFLRHSLSPVLLEFQPRAH